MEKIYKIKQEDLCIETGVWVDMECCMCGEEATIHGENEKELLQNIQDHGWQMLNSDKYQMVGHWCGQCVINDSKKIEWQ